MRLTVTEGGTHGSGGLVDGHYCFGGYGSYGFSIFDDTANRLLPTAVTCYSCRSSYGDSSLFGAFTGTSHWCVWSPGYNGVSILNIDFGQQVTIDSYAFDCGGASNCAVSWHIETSDDLVTWTTADTRNGLALSGGNTEVFDMVRSLRHASKSSKALPVNGDARLSAYPKGRIEIYKDGKWGTLCGHYWWNNNHGASMICKQAGYAQGGKQVIRGGSSVDLPGPNSMDIVTGNRYCNGGEQNIFECQLMRGELEGCSHNEDVGAECFGAREHDDASSDEEDVENYLSRSVEYYDLSDTSRNVTQILDALRADGWPGDYYTDKSSSCAGYKPPGQPFAGFGWYALPKPGISNWGVCQGFNKIICEEKPSSPSTGIVTSAVFDLDASTHSGGTVTDSKSGMEFGTRATETGADGVAYWDLSAGELHVSSGSRVETDEYTHAYVLKWVESNHGYRTLLRHTSDHCALTEGGTNKLGFYSNRGGSFRPSGYTISPQQEYWEVLVVTGRADGPGSSRGTSTFYAQDAAGALQAVGTADRVCSGDRYYHVGHRSSQNPGKVARVLAWDRVLSDAEIGALASLGTKPHVVPAAAQPGYDSRSGRCHALSHDEFFIFSYHDDDSKNDIPDNAADIGSGFENSNAFFVGNDKLSQAVLNGLKL
jgi:hypothetical protein